MSWRPPRAAWLLFIALALTELVAHFVIVHRVPRLEDWRAATAIVRREWRPKDLVLGAPPWTDPIVRWLAGDRISRADAGRSDLAPYERVWVLSIRGHSPERTGLEDKTPALERRFGRVHLARYDVGRSPVVYDFVANLRSARPAIVTNETGEARACPWQPTGNPNGGGLHGGVMPPFERFICDPLRSWVWVGETTIEDLTLAPRHCVWSHPPSPGQTLRIVYPDVPIGRAIVVYGGIYYYEERGLTGGPVNLAVRVAGEEVGRMTHRDGDGWKRLEADTRALAGRHAEVAIEVSAPDDHVRTFCWAGNVRSRERTP